MADSKKDDSKLKTTYYHLEMVPRHNCTELVADIYVHHPHSDSDASAVDSSVGNGIPIRYIVCPKTRIQLWDLNGLTYASECCVAVTRSKAPETAKMTRIKLEVHTFGYHFWVECDEKEDGTLEVRDQSALTRDPPVDPLDTVKCLTKSDSDGSGSESDGSCDNKPLKIKKSNSYNVTSQKLFYIIRETVMLEGKEKRTKLNRKGI